MNNKIIIAIYALFLQCALCGASEEESEDEKGAEERAQVEQLKQMAAGAHNDPEALEGKGWLEKFLTRLKQKQGNTEEEPTENTEAQESKPKEERRGYRENDEGSAYNLAKVKEMCSDVVIRLKKIAERLQAD